MSVRYIGPLDSSPADPGVKYLGPLDQSEPQAGVKYLGPIEEEPTFFLGGMTRPYVRGTQKAAASTNQLLANAARLAGKGAGWVGDKIGIEPGGAFDEVADWLEKKAAEVTPPQIEGQSLAEQIPESLTEGVLGLPAYALAAKAAGPVAGLAGVSALQEAPQGGAAAAKAALRGAGMGGLLKMTEPLTRPLRAGVLGGTTYATTKDIPESVTMGALGAMQPKGPIGRMELLKEVKDLPRRGEQLPVVGKAIGAVNRGLIEDYGKTQEYLDVKRQVQTKAAERTKEEFEFAKGMSELPLADQKRLSQIIRGSITTRPEKYQKAAEAAKRIGDIEGELRDLDLLKGDTYLTKYSKEQRAQMVRAIKIKELQGQLKTGKQAPAGVVSQIKGLKKEGVPPEYLRLTEDQLLDKLHKHYETSGELYLKQAHKQFEKKTGGQPRWFPFRKELKRLGLSYSKHRTKATGDIQEAPYLYAKGEMEAVHDIEMGRWFAKVAERPEWTNKELRSQFPDAETGTKQGDFRKLPNDPKLGKLKGQWVEKHIWDDINQSVKQSNEFVKVWDYVLGLWKAGKVIYNPATWGRNIMSNTILADVIGDTSWHNPVAQKQFTESIIDLAHKKGDYAELKDMGYLGREWFGGEVKELLLDIAAEKTTTGTLKQMAKKIHNMAGGGYQGIEQIFKTWIYKHNKSKGATPQEAARLAEKAIFDYTNIPPGIRWAKRYWSPFITFTYKAIPALAGASVERPWKIIKYILVAKGIEEVARRQFGETEEDVKKEKAVLPNYMKHQTLPLINKKYNIPSHVRVPLKDENGRSKYLDLSYILPWGDIGEQWGQTNIGGRPILPNHPLWMTAAETMLNKSAFTGRQIWNKADPLKTKAGKIAGHFWRQVFPTWLGIPGNKELQGWSFHKMGAAVRGDLDRMGRPREKWEAVLDTILGLKLRSISRPEEMVKRLNEIDREARPVIGEFVNRIAELQRNNRPAEDVQKIVKEYIKWVESMIEQQEKIINPTSEESQ